MPFVRSHLYFPVRQFPPSVQLTCQTHEQGHCVNVIIPQPINFAPRSLMLPFAKSRKMHHPATMDPDYDVEPYLRTLHIDGTLLELGPEEEAFFKAETGIQDTGELSEHIVRVHQEAYKASAYLARVRHGR